MLFVIYLFNYFHIFLPSIFFFSIYVFTLIPIQQRAFTFSHIRTLLLFFLPLLYSLIILIFVSFLTDLYLPTSSHSIRYMLPCVSLYYFLSFPFLSLLQSVPFFNFFFRFSFFFPSLKQFSFLVFLSLSLPLPLIKGINIQQIHILLDFPPLLPPFAICIRPIHSLSPKDSKKISLKCFLFLSVEFSLVILNCDLH